MASTATRILARIGLLTCVLLVAATMTPIPSYADPLDDYITSVTQTCDKLTQEKEKLTNLAKQKGPAAIQENDKQMATVSEYVERARSMIKGIKEAPPRTAAERDDYIRKINETLGVANTAIKTAQRRLGLAPFGAIDADARGLMTRFGRWDGAPSGDAAPAEIDIPRHRDTKFFEVEQCKAGVKQRAEAGATKFRECGACSEAEKQQHLKKLSVLRDQQLKKCETN